MKREIIYTTGFNRDARRWAKKNPKSQPDIRTALAALEADAFQPSLGTHKLSGGLSAYRACSAGYNVRILFEIVTHNGNEAIRLIALGTHDEMY